MVIAVAASSEATQLWEQIESSDDARKHNLGSVRRVTVPWETEVGGSQVKSNPGNLANHCLKIKQTKNKYKA